VSVTAVLSAPAAQASADDKTAAPAPLTPKQLAAELAKKPTGAEADALARRLVATFGDKALTDLKAGPKVEETTVAFAARYKAPVTAVFTMHNAQGTLTATREFVPVGETGLYAWAGELPNFFDYEFKLTARIGIAADPPATLNVGKFRLEWFPPHPDSALRPGVPEGKVTEHEFKDSKVFPGTSRKFYVYIPAQYDGKAPAAVMVFQDGQWYSTRTGEWKTPNVFDNLIAAGEMPVTVGVFINPGVFPNEVSKDGKPRSNRSFEYDTLSADYAKFVLEEILPLVEKTHNVKLRTDRAGRAIAGISSGGICAWTAAWERPEAFSKVLSHVGSFTNIRGGHVYPALIRKTERKPIRAWLQDGTNDLDNVHGNWPLANMEMEKALKFAGYDYKYSWSEGFHGGRHGASEFPDELRWLWRGWKDELPTPITTK
jgi:enterochelin esterase family protein